MVEVKNNLFIVNEKPFIALAGEVHNSNSSSPDYMEGVWDKAQNLGMNTLLLPVSWELTEPEEGRFDFEIPDALIHQARERQMKLIFLWFGTWKNAQCMYAPEWVKTDLVRFPRAQVKKRENKTNLENFYGMPYTSLSYLGEETKKADAKAFAAFMSHLKEMDEKEHTVIMVQVENETGLQGAAREHSDLADELFAGNVPEGLAAYMRANTKEMAENVRNAVEAGIYGKTWGEVFGNTAEELFSAYYIASYVNAVAEAGKEVYDLPMAVNCWLDKGEEPGKYPSGGPVARVMEVWKYAAPAIHVFAPDIYVTDFCGICNAYTKLNNPLFIPETATHSHAGPRLAYCVGHYHALGFAPFAFEDMGKPFNDLQSYLFGVDVSDPLLKIPQDEKEYAWYNRTIDSMMPLIASKYGTKELQAVISEVPDQDMMIFGRIGFKILMNIPMITRKDNVCMIVQENQDTFYILANACIIAYFSADPKLKNVDILSLEEGSFEEGVWKPGRRLNGDEASSLKCNEPVLWKMKLFLYE